MCAYFDLSHTKEHFLRVEDSMHILRQLVSGWVPPTTEDGTSLIILPARLCFLYEEEADSWAFFGRHAWRLGLCDPANTPWSPAGARRRQVLMGEQPLPTADADADADGGGGGGGSSSSSGAPWQLQVAVDAQGEEEREAGHARGRGLDLEVEEAGEGAMSPLPV